MQEARIYDELRKLLGPDRVSAEVQDLVSYSSDMYPRNQILKLGSRLPATRPMAVCFPESVEDICRIVQFCGGERIPVVAYGAGSGVCGATIPEEGGIILDTKRLCRVLELNRENLTVTVEPGLLGERLEDILDQDGLTLGHFPSSINCSTIGGYVACRSAGQYSSRYGKIEDLTLGLEVVLPDGSVAHYGVLGGGHRHDPMLAAQLGAEGTLGIVTRICLKVEPLPEKFDFRGFAFLDSEDGIESMKRIMQVPLRPTVLRLYDPLDSLIAGFHSKTADGEDIHVAASRLSGMKKAVASVATELNDAGLAMLLYRPGMLNKLAEIIPARPLLIVGVQGTKAQVSRQWGEVRRVVSRIRGEELGPEPGWNWFKHRYAVSYKQAKMFAAGAFVDTMEVATTWENLHPLYKAVLKAMGKYVFIMAHFSHAYEEGCSIYFTFAGYRPSVRGATATYQRAWKLGQETVARYGGTISHHHSVGLLKKGLLDRETPGGKELFAAFKAVLDPRQVMNPGKLYNIDV